MRRVEAATTSVRAELNDACAIAVSNAITPLRQELTPLREQNVAFAVKIEELERLQAEAEEEHRDLRQAFELLELQTPASPAAPPLDMGPDRRAPKFDRCGEALGVGFASYPITGADGLPKSVALLAPRSVAGAGSARRRRADDSLGPAPSSETGRRRLP